MLFRDIAFERRRTRDLLLDYASSILPIMPRRSAGLSIIYPWGNTTISVLSRQIYEIAQANGFTGTEDEFWQRFAQADKEFYVGSIDTFPVPGVEDNLYLDNETGILYYFRIAPWPINEDVANHVGAIIVDRTEENCFIYIPVRALLIEDTILDCGSAADYIE